MAYQDQQGRVALPKLQPDGSVPVDAGATDTGEILRLIWISLERLRLGMIECGTCEDVDLDTEFAPDDGSDGGE